MISLYLNVGFGLPGIKAFNFSSLYPTSLNILSISSLIILVRLSGCTSTRAFTVKKIGAVLSLGLPTLAPSVNKKIISTKNKK